MRKLLLIPTLFFVLAACENKSDVVNAVKFPPPIVKGDAEVDDKVLEVADPGQKSLKGDANAQEYIGAGNGIISVQDTSKKIVKDGSISFETTDVNKTRKRILYSIKKLSGYVVEDNQSLNGEENRKEYTLKIRIPAKNFDILVDSASSTADKIDEKNISITDVTTRFIDVSTRLANKKLLENRYLDLLKKSAKVSDLLEIENKLTEIRSDIESTQGQLNYLKKQVSYSSLSITFYTRHVNQVKTGNNFAYKFGHSLGKGFGFLQRAFFGIITLWPTLILAFIFYLVIRAKRKRGQAKE